MDKHLIDVVNRLQDSMAHLGPNTIDLPQITVVGSQSSGKSSVLENIVGRDFLPRGSGIVTRRPLVLQLINRRAPEGVVTPDNKTNEYEWGEFLHLPDKKIHDFSKIRNEIVRYTDATTGNKGISPDPINLRIYSPNVLTLTLVDLPGLTKVPVGDQPRDIEKLIREMILKYISKRNAIILAVTAANTDLANSDGLKLAREVDPQGDRTIGVLTKIDLMDKGTDVLDIMEGKIIPLRFGYVPVVNRGQQDINANKSIRDAIAYEQEYFKEHPAYSAKAQYCGTPYLARRLNSILMNHIRQTLPEMKVRIDQALKKYKMELAQLGPSDLGSPSSIVLSVCTEFANEYKSILDGQNRDVSAQELSGGARISYVFHEIFTNGINVIEPGDEITDTDVRTILYNCSGVTPSLFVSNKPLVFLLKKQIRRLEAPSLKCIQLIYDELIRVLNQIITRGRFQRYPVLRDHVKEVFSTFLRRAMEPTIALVKDIVFMEANYINTAHPQFQTMRSAMDQVSSKLKLSTPVQLDPKTGKPLPQPETLKDTKAEAKDSPFGGFFGDMFTSRGKKRLAAMDPPPTVLKASGSMSDREMLEVEIVKIMLNSYFDIVKRTVTDLVPKAITYSLILYSKEEIQKELLAVLYKSDSMDELVQENYDTKKRRDYCNRMVQGLSAAQEIVSSI